ncbi:MAG: hypothetical protein ABFR82_12720 [Nitrospirota bacterium]
MIKSYSVGEDIDAWCTKCKLELDHTIVAMVDNLPKKVECNTCKGKHNYRKKPAERTRTKTKTGVRKVRKTVTEKYNEVLSGLAEGALSNATKYSIKGTFEKDDIIDHSKFGIGVVLSIIKVNKAEVLFKDGLKLLIQNQE